MLISLGLLLERGLCSEGRVLQEGPSSLEGEVSKAFSYYERSKEGWYWYKDEVKKEPEKPKEAEQKVQKAVLPRLLERYTYQELWNMHPQEFREVMQAYLEKAVQSPTEENVLDYVILADLARRKSLAFAGTFTYVVQKYPELSGNLATYSYTVPGIKARTELVQSEIDSVIGGAGEKYGLLFFTSPNCRFCEAQRGILKYFAAAYSWPVKEVSVQDPEGEAAVRKFSISVVPTVVLVSREKGDWMPVSVGVVSLSTLLDRLYRAVMVMEGKLSPEQYLIWGFERESPSDPLLFPDLSRINLTKEVRKQ